MTFGFIVAGLASLYLLLGIFGGGFAQATAADYARFKGVITVAEQALVLGLGVATVGLIISQWGEETTGYILVVVAAALGFALPFLFTSLGGVISGTAMKRSFSAFQTAAYLPGFLGALLIVWDVVRRFATAFQNRAVNPDEMEYGTDARKEHKRVRLSLLAKCWEGPYCRESIRPHCPIYVKRAACWKEKKGCYCEEEIVIAAASKVQGVMLEMAPASGFTFSNASTPTTTGAGLQGMGGSSPVGFSGSVGGQAASPAPVTPSRVELTPAEKRERCRNCVVYNEHEQEKYRLLLPVVIIGSLLLVLMFAVPLRGSVDTVFKSVDALAARLAFTGGPRPSLTNPPDLVAWGLVAAVGLMFVSKTLQFLEWACFKAKI